MGLFNTIILECPACGKPYESQTKVIGESLLANIRIGDEVPGGEEDLRILLADPCDECGSGIIVTVLNNKLHSAEAWDMEEEVPCPDGDRRRAFIEWIDNTYGDLSSKGTDG